MFNTDSYGNIYFTAGVSVGNYPITLNTPTHVLVAGAGGLISKVATSQLISNTDVTSVFGRQGAITALPGDYDTDMVKEKTNLYFTTNRARAVLSVTTTGSTGPATYNPLTGVINIPQYQNEFNGVSSFNTRTGAVTLTALDVTTALTYTPVAVETDPIWAAQKVLYYTKVEADSLFATVGHTHTTTVITEGTNLYFTTARARASFSAGANITIDANGVISGVNAYVLPTATDTILGGVKIGSGITITSGVISVPVYTLASLGGLPLAGGTMTGPIILKEGAANGLKFPNDVFGGSGDTAGMRLIARSGEAMSLEIYLTNDADDWFNISVPNNDAAKVNGNTIWNTANLTNLNQLTNGPGYITSYVNTWDANTRDVAGYVAAPGAVANKVWKTDGSGNPAWRDDADSVTTSLPWTSITGRPTTLSAFTNDLSTWPNNFDISGIIYSRSHYYVLNAAGTGWEPFAYRTGTTNRYNVYTNNIDATGYFSINGTGPVGQSIEASGHIYTAQYIKVDNNQGIVCTGNQSVPFLGNGSGWYTAGTITAAAFYESSDIRYKNVIETNPILSLESLDVIKFTRKGSSVIRYGYSAQQVRSLSEDLVGGTKDDLTVNYSDVHTLKIASLEKRIAELEAKLNN